MKDPRVLPNSLVQLLERNWDARLYDGKTDYSLLLGEEPEIEPEPEQGFPMYSSPSSSSESEIQPAEVRKKRKIRTNDAGVPSNTRQRVRRESAIVADRVTAQVSRLERNLEEALLVETADLLTDEQFEEYFKSRCNISHQDCILGLRELQNFAPNRSVDFFLVDGPWECMDASQYPRDHQINDAMMADISMKMAYLLSNSGNAVVYYGLKKDQGSRWKKALTDAGLLVDDSPLLISFAPEACGRGSSGHKMRNVFHYAWVVCRSKGDRGKEKPVRNLQGMPTYVRSEYSCDTNHISGYKAPSARERLKDAQGLVRKEERPVDLMKELLHRYTNARATVIDVFGGTFSLGMACMYMEREYVSFEIDKRCFDAGIKRLKLTVKSLINSGKLKPPSLLSRQLVPELSLADWKRLENTCSSSADEVVLNAPPAIIDRVVVVLGTGESIPHLSDMWVYMQSLEGVEELLPIEQTIHGVFVQDSTLPGTGKSLFAMKEFRRGELIRYYWGRILSPDQVKVLHPDNGLSSDRLLNLEVIASASQRHADLTIDASLSCAASYSQHKPHEKANSLFREILDSRYRDDWLRVITDSPLDAISNYRLLELIAHKPIKIGEEIFVDYGEGYFKEGEVVESDSDSKDSEN